MVKIDQLLSFLSPLGYKGVTYLFRKPKAILKKCSNQNWKSFIHSVSKLVRMKEPSFIRTSFDTLWMKLFQFWLLRFFQNWFGLSKEVLNSFLTQGLRNSSWSNLEVKKKEPLWSKIEEFFALTTLTSCHLSPLSYKGLRYLFRKPKAILKKRSNQNWKSFIQSVSKLVRMKEPLFHSNQFWHTVNKVFPILIAAFF